jgi:hypothetical protein
LRSELDRIFFGGFAQTEVSYFNSPLMEEYVLGFQVVMDHLVRQLMQISNRTDDLSDDQFGFSLRDSFVLLQVERQVRSLTVL